MTDLTLLVRASDPITSIEAAESTVRFSAGHCDRILAALGKGPASAADLAQATGLTVVQIDRRLPELLRNGKVRVKTEAGADVRKGGYRVWEVVA